MASAQNNIGGMSAWHRSLSRVAHVSLMSYTRLVDVLHARCQYIHATRTRGPVQSRCLEHALFNKCTSTLCRQE
eukprot:7804323-Lingulodinium_polyedra.AAC.1